MQTIRILALFASMLSVFFCSNLRAANIVWVSDNPTNVGFSSAIAGTADDTFVTMLQAAGHTVQRFSSDDSQNVLLTAQQIADLNTNDLIILGRSLGSGFTQTPQGNQWNTNITRPIICQSSFLIRASRLGWMTNESSFNGVPMPLALTIPVNSTNAYLFGGTPLIGNLMTGNYDLAMEANTSQTVDFPIAGGRVLATGLASNIVIADFQAGTAVKFGTNILAGYRMYFASGNREASVIATAGSNNLTTAGQSVFLRAVTLALNNGVPPNLGVAPSITLQPTNQAVCVGLPVSLVATADGENPLRYQWYFDDTVNGNNPLSSGTNATLTFTFQNTNAGNYTLVVTNVTGAITSSVAVLSISGTGTIASAVANQTNCPGSSATFSTTATGSGTLQYTWRKGGTILQGPDGTSSYTIPTVVAGDAGQYSVTVVGDCNTVSNSFIFVVAPAPIITAQPQNQIAPMGNGAVFSVTALTTNAGAAPLSYQWKTNGVDVTGATASTFAISNLTLAANGIVVSVGVTNCAGGLLSSTATLTVTPISAISFDFNTPGQFTNAPYNLINADWHNNVIVNAQPFGPIVPWESPTGGVGVATGGGSLDLIFNNGTDQSSTFIPLSYDFSLPGKTLTVSIMTKIKVPTAAQRAIQLAFITATNGDPALGIQTTAGVNATANLGFMSAIFQSSVINVVNPGYHLRAQTKVIPGTATIEVIPVNTTTNALTTNNWYKFVAKFTNVKGPAGSLTASNYTMESYIQDWGQFGTNVNDSVLPGGIALASGVLLQTNVDMVNRTRMYLSIRCFENGGNDNFDNIFVTTTNGPVFFVAPLADQTVAQGGTATWRTMVDGDGPYTYQWYKNGVAIPGAGNWKYTTPGVTLADSGAQFSVVVTSTNNSVTNVANLTVTPLTLAVLSAGSVDGGTVGLRFNQPVDLASAETAANYSINGTPARAARLRTYVNNVLNNNYQKRRTNGTEVLLTPDGSISGAFTVTVANVTSASGTLIGGINSATGLVAGLTGFDVDPTDLSQGQAYQVLSSLPAVGTIPGENYSFAPGQFEVTGGGHDIFGSFDGFRYVYRQVAGDFDVKVRVPYVDLVRTGTKAGFDARVSLSSVSANVGVFANPALPGRNFIEGVYRTNFWNTTLGWGLSSTNFYPETWLRFRRAGNTFMRYFSTNGVNWVHGNQLTTVYPVFPTNLYLGFAVCPTLGVNTIQQTATAQFDSYGDFAGYPGAVITIVSNVANATINAGAAATLAVTNTVSGGGIPGGGEVVYIWQRTNSLVGGWTNMATAGATNNTVSTGVLYRNDNGAQYRVIIQAPGAAPVTSAVATVTVNDTTGGTLLSATAAPGRPNTLLLVFSEPLSDATALNAANYAVTNSLGVGIAVSGVSFLNGDRTTVIVTLVDATTGNLNVTLKGLQDLNGNATASNYRTNFSSQPIPTGPIILEWYGGTPTAGNMSDLTNFWKYTSGNPDFYMYSNSFGYNGGLTIIPTGPDNYAQKVYTYFVPPTNGAYKFWLRGDDFLALNINTNISAAASTNRSGFGVMTNAINMTGNNAAYVVANSFTSAVLNAGQAYYTEVLWKEGGGGDGMALAITAATDTGTPTSDKMAGSPLFVYPNELAPRMVAQVEIYTNLFNTGVNSNPNYPDNGLVDLSNALQSVKVKIGAPDMLGYNKYLGCATNKFQTSFEHYLGRIFSYYVAPTNGNYKFYIHSDDSSQLLMNTNGTDPAGAVVVGQVTANTGGYTLAGQNINLTNGQRYYIEGRWKEGTGGDGMWVAVRSQGDATVPGLGAAIVSIDPAQLEFPTNLASTVWTPRAIISPVNPTVAEGQSVTFAGAGFGNAYVWLKNGQFEFQSTNAPTPVYYTTPPLTSADNGAVYALYMTNNFGTAIATSTVTVLPDVSGVPPAIASAVGSQYGDSVTITFTEKVTAYSAQQLGNYSIAGLQITGVDYDDVARNRVTLRTRPQVLGALYTVVVNGVTDFSLVPNAAVNETKSFHAWGFGGVGGVLVELWTNNLNAAVEYLLTDPHYINNAPDVSYYTNSFGVGPYQGQTGREFYGGRVSGLFMPPSNGLYRFYVRADDNSMLFMNTNGPSPADRVLIARNDGANSGTYNLGLGLGRPGASQSPVISLTNGTGYYMEALFKEGTGGDYLEVVMRAIDPGTGLEIGGVPVPAAGNTLSGGFFSAPGNPDLIQFVVNSIPPSEIFVNELDPVSLTLNATAIPASLTAFVSYQWQRSNVVSTLFTNIPGKTSPTLSFYAPLEADGATYRLVATLPGTTLRYETLVHVTTITDPQVLLSVSSLDGNTIGARFARPVDLGTGQTPENYQINGGAITVLGAVVRQSVDPRTVVLTLQNPVGGDFTVDAFTIGDQSVNLNLGDTYGIVGGVQGLTAMDMGSPLAAGSSFTATNGEISVVAGGADIWGTSDQGHFTLGQRSGDFDIWTRVDSLRPVSVSPDIAKAGVVVRNGTNADAKTLTLLMNPPVALGGRDLVEAGSRTNIVPGVPGPTGPWPSSTNVTPAGIPNAWVRLKRTGFIFRALYSSNGVDWVGFATNFVDFPRTVYVGLGTTAHNNTAPATVAEYRNLHIPNSPSITGQPAPASQSVAFHGSTSYTVTADNPPDSGPLTYTWRRDGVVVGTGDTLNIPDARGVDAGNYQVEVGNDGGSLYSEVVTLTVNNGLPTIGSDSLNATQNIASVVSAASLTGNDSDPEGSNLVFRTVSGILPVTVGTNFDQGNLTGASLFALGGSGLGTATVSTNGYVVLHSAAINSAGSLILEEITPGKRVSGFRASFKLQISEGSPQPADGFSFNFAPDVPLGATTTLAAEQGGGTGFSFCLDNYQFVPFAGPGTPAGAPGGGTANTSGMKIIFGGTNVIGVQVPTWNRPTFVPVTVEVINSAVTVFVDGTNVFGTVPLPSVTSTGRFGFYARDGGQYQSALLDDLSITVYTATTAGGGTVTSAGGNVNYLTPACSGSDTFYYIVGDGEVGGDVIAPVAVNLYEGVTQPPIIVTCATNRTYTLYTNSQIALPNLTGELVVTDNCGTPVVTQSPVAGTLLSAGPNVVTFTATDAGGSNSTCQITITVVVVKPQIIATSLIFGGGSFSGQFQTANGVNYRVEYKNDLNDLTWTLLTTIAGDGTVKTFTDPGPLPADHRFYQIVPVP